jgi:outer membrane biosynthesis protein TonB
MNITKPSSTMLLHSGLVALSGGLLLTQFVFFNSPKPLNAVNEVIVTPVSTPLPTAEVTPTPETTVEPTVEETPTKNPTATTTPKKVIKK